MRSRGARAQRGIAEQAVSGSGHHRVRDAAGAGRQAGDDAAQAGDDDAGESSQDNRRHNLRRAQNPLL